MAEKINLQVQGLEYENTLSLPLVNFDLTVEVKPGSDLLHLSRISNVYELWSSALNEEYPASEYISNDITLDIGLNRAEWKKQFFKKIKEGRFGNAASQKTQ